ncbi:MAG: tRNA lysidine(34) synthetase TilS, partial [Paracoccaceae bacterium]
MSGNPSGIAERLTDLLREKMTPGRDKRLGVAVSGGGDSMALLHLLADWRKAGGPELLAVTVDHGLRPEAAAEAGFVADHCLGLGIAHETLCWTGWDGRGNLPDQARRARYRLIVGWARRHGLARVALGHTLDDQAETVLMRLLRGSGVDGLSAMADCRVEAGIAFCRPLLSVQRQDLRHYLTARSVPWLEDPTNDDPDYDRVKARQALATLAGLG